MAGREEPLLVLVTGPPGSGKTTLARRVARELGLPLYAKDDFKETLFDSLGAGDRDWSRRLGAAVFRLLFVVMRVELEAGRSVVVEGNFYAESAETDCASLPPHRIVQVHCAAPEDVLVDRYLARDRHPGHHDDESVHDVRRAIREGRHRPLALDGALVEVDTSQDADPVGRIVALAR